MNKFELSNAAIEALCNLATPQLFWRSFVSYVKINKLKYDCFVCNQTIILSTSDTQEAHYQIDEHGLMHLKDKNLLPFI